MKKMILISIAAVVVLFISFGLFKASKLTHIQIKKTVLIKADNQHVFDKVVYLKNFPEWSPFLEADPTQKITVKGTDGQVGAQYHWEGDKGKDLGFQEIKEINPLKYIRMECDIQKPFKANPTFEYHFKKVSQGIQVTQDFNLNSSIGDAFFMWLFGAKSDMEKINGRGMELLKAAAERN